MKLVVGSYTGTTNLNAAAAARRCNEVENFSNPGSISACSFVGSCKPTGDTEKADPKAKRMSW